MAKKKPKEKEDSYRVGTADVSVSVDVGLGQIGTVTMFLEDKPLGSSPSPVGQRNLGSGTDLVGQLLTVEVSVTDVSVMTNKMSVVVHLTGGNAPKSITVTDEVEKQGDIRDFGVFVLFRE